MDNLLLAISPPGWFLQEVTGRTFNYPASLLYPITGGGDLDRNRVADSIGMGWRFAPEYAHRHRTIELSGAALE
jgi:hypothetical protein